MREEFDKYLCKTYPKMFANRDKSMQVTAMCWGFEHGDGWFQIINKLCGNIQHHIDWRNQQREINLRYNEIATVGKQGKAEQFADMVAQDYGDKGYNEDQIRTMCENMIERPLRDVPPPCPQVVVDQVKEKFGTLRFYYSGGDDVIDGMVQIAESMTSVTCEVCGNVGRRRGSGWVRTLCDEHSKESDYAVSRFVEVGDTVSLFTKDGFEDVSVVNVIDEFDGILEVLDKKNATLKVQPMLIGGVDLGSYQLVAD